MSAALLGSLGFIIPQLIIRIPLLTLLASTQGYAGFAAAHPVALLFLVALSAALFETAGRLFVFGVLLKNNLCSVTAFGAGLGHGAAESILLIGGTYISNLSLALMINTGTLPAGEAYAIAAQTLASTDPQLFLAAGAERVFTLAIQLALSVTVCFFMAKGRTLFGALFAIAVHTAIDFFIPLLSLNGAPTALTESILLIIAVGALALAMRERKKFKSAAGTDADDAGADDDAGDNSGDDITDGGNN